MAPDDGTVKIAVMAFGPLAERLGGRRHELTVSLNSTIRDLVVDLGLTEWISFGLSVAMNGNRCSMDTIVEDGAEVALLPPVSGG
jgi:molybdopterin converting factor small subunit